MAWDLRGVLLKKAEMETARLLDVAFRLRARTARRLAAELAPDEAALAGRTVTEAHVAFIARLAMETGVAADAPEQRWAMAEAEERRALAAELGGPAPHGF